MIAFTFLAPAWLLLLGAVAAMAVVYVVLQARRERYTVRFTNVALLDSVAPKRPGWRRHVPAALFLVATALLVTAVARPATDRKVPRERATIVLAIDTSLSMEADDVSPTRIDAAKTAAKGFLGKLPPQINVGLVTFNGNAAVRVAPTTDRQQVRNAIDQIQLGEKTAIGEAIFASLDALKAVPPSPQGKPVPARIILMSDGETTTGRADAEGAAAAKKAGVPVETVAFGTDHGTITIPQEPGPVSVSVNREALAKIAEETGGKAFSAVSSDELRQIYSNVGSSIGYTTQQTEIGLWFVEGALVLILATAAFSLAWFSRLP